MNYHQGIDEAGRGSAIGPLVVCGFAMREADLPMLDRISLADSKELAPGRREEIYGELKKLPARVRISRISPAKVDSAVAHNGLNGLEMTAMVAFIRSVRPSVAYIDALTSAPRRFGRQIEALTAPLHVRVVAENRADSKYPLVMAASIIAKVMRDAAVAALRRRHGDFGSGYPGDLKTRVFLAGFAEKGDFPGCVRRSWSTIARLTGK